MANIEVITSQNVPIEYELAPLKERIFAFAIDFLILFFTQLFLGLLIGFAGFSETTSLYFVFLVMVPLFFFYSPAMEIFNNGQSVGKMALKIKVIKITGNEVAANDYLVRWIFRMIDIYFSLGSVASIMIGTSVKGQRLGDLIANTTVIKIQPRFTLNLQDLEKIISLKNYEPRYPEVVKFSEEEIVFLKSILDRTLKYNNKAHKEAIMLATNNVAKKLNLEKIPANRTDFIRTLIKDYVVLTR